MWLHDASVCVCVQFYSRSMAKRLLLDQSQSMDAEESMLNRLKVRLTVLSRTAMMSPLHVIKTTCMQEFLSSKALHWKRFTDLTLHLYNHYL